MVEELGDLWYAIDDRDNFEDDRWRSGDAIPKILNRRDDEVQVTPDLDSSQDFRLLCHDTVKNQMMIQYIVVSMFSCLAFVCKIE